MLNQVVLMLVIVLNMSSDTKISGMWKFSSLSKFLQSVQFLLQDLCLDINIDYDLGEVTNSERVEPNSKDHPSNSY